MRRLAPVAALLASLSGCLFATTYYGHDEAPAWHQAGVFARMPSPGFVNGYNISRGDAREGVPFVDADLVARLGTDRFILSSVAWRAAPARSLDGYDCMLVPSNPVPGLWWSSADGVVGAFWNGTSAEQVHRWFLDFASNVSAATPAALEALAVEFQHGSHRFLNATLNCPIELYSGPVALPGPFQLERLHARVTGDSVPLPDGGNRAWAGEGDGWTFQFLLEQRLARRSDRNGTLELRVLSTDWVGLERRGPGMSAPEGATASDEQTGRWLNETFAALGLGTPRPPSWAFEHRTMHGD